MAQTLSQIKSMLASHGLRPKHALGQNFLHDHQKMQEIIAAADVAQDDLVLEVGPGTGALTERLLEAGAKVAMVEIDAGLAPILQPVVLAHPGRAGLLIADILDSKRVINPHAIKLLEQLGLGRDRETFKLIANLPYQVASPLIANLAVDYPLMSLAVVMVQKEVALRLKASAGEEDYGALGIMVQATCHVQVVTQLSPGCFWPSPKVESAVVKLVRREKPLTHHLAGLHQLLHKVFSQRRKQLGRILGRGRPFPEGITADMRPEQLTIDQFIQLLHWTN